MPDPERTPTGELIRYASVAAIMSAAMLVLSRGKWLFALLLGIWLFFALKRLRRALQKRR
jgi:hypothetical protein